MDFLERRRAGRVLYPAGGIEPPGPPEIDRLKGPVFILAGKDEIVNDGDILHVRAGG